MKLQELSEDIKYKDIFDSLIYEAANQLVGFIKSNYTITNFIKTRLLINPSLCYNIDNKLVIIYLCEKEDNNSIIEICNLFHFKSYKNILYKEYISLKNNGTYIVV